MRMNLLRLAAGRLLPASVLVLTAVPLHWVLLGPEAGPEVVRAVVRTDRIWLHGWILASITLGAAAMLSRFAPMTGEAFRASGRALDRPAGSRVASAAALFAGLAAGLVGVFVLQSEPLLVDVQTQLVHARYLAEGRLTAPADATLPAWVMPLGLVGPNGWVSQYPPGQIVLFALALRLGAIALLGPVLHALAVFLLADLLERVTRERIPARAAVLLYAFSPMALVHAAGMLSSTTAAAGILLGAWAAARSDGRLRWSIVAGAAIGFVLLTRPLSAPVLALPAVLASLWLQGRRPRASEWIAGASTFLVFACLFLLWNAHLYGAPFTTGYAAAQGAAHSFGFHTDPWGYAYGPRQALGHTSLDLIALGRHMLEISLPVVPAVGLVYLGRQGFSHLERVAWTLALLPVSALFFFWHHPDMPGPRLLGEALPFWCLLAALAAARLMRLRPRFAPQLLLLSIAAAALLVPHRLGGYRAETRAFASRLSVDMLDNAVVFVHGPWIERAAMRLAAAGTRGDVVQAAARHSSTCRIETAANALEEGTTPPVLVVEPVPPSPETVRSGPMAEARLGVGEPFPEPCARNLRADAYATVPVTTRLWKYDLPGLEPRRGVALVRDLGPERNQTALAAWPGRTAYLAFLGADGKTWVMPYEEGIARVWGAGE